jgi:hypothetical protein
VQQECFEQSLRIILVSVNQGRIPTISVHLDSIGMCRLALIEVQLHQVLLLPYLLLQLLKALKNQKEKNPKQCMTYLKLNQVIDGKTLGMSIPSVDESLRLQSSITSGLNLK